MRRLAASFIAFTLALGLWQPALAWPSEVKYHPNVFDTGEAPEGLYLWVNTDENRVVVRVLGEREYRLRFRLRYGVIYNLRTEGFDQNDQAKYSQDRDQLSVKLYGSDVLEGFDFMSQGNRIEIDCEKADGDDCDRDEIFLGEDGEHPDELPFTINRKD
jgi:hypothetical protein